MKTLLGLFVCCVLVTTGTTLECEVCTGIGTSCTGKMQTCEAGEDTCTIAVSECTVAGFNFQIPLIFKACESSRYCNLGPHYLDFGHGFSLRTMVSCCVGDACRTATPQVPPIITRLNGKQCPACFSSYNSCSAGDMVDCVGPQTECLDLAVTVTHGTVVSSRVQKGCVTKGACDDVSRGKKLLEGLHSIITKAECRAAS
ncbi:phospholipase A2 inhibitor and Ly6/PLAUR domain-containing protein-like [Hemicordylus capensis]|uniref:phospholipase A2 inhibitor and Ly6/PLAUR domain-containing protein-like n=1 Tax=Hemicordylus capensis TaxID=884348 RepID=UPI002304CA1B|nr:phospholipase A2 inhibitor and Ly6/PLAUR domain-containing protein-like [Hemicordylus capensis]